MPSPQAFTVDGKVFFDPHPGKQREVLALLKDCVLGTGPAPANVFLWGNRGSGKSRMVRAFLHAVAMAHPGFKYVVIRRNMPDLRLNHTIYLESEMHRLGGTYHETFGMCHYANGKDGGPESLGFYRQCETEGDAEKIVGAEACVLYADEAPQIKWDLLRMIAPSLRVPEREDGTPAPYRALVIHGGNPVGESVEEHWAYFVDQTVDPELDPEYDPADWLAIEIRRSDNPSINEKTYRKQFAGLTPQYRKAWLDGVRMDARTLFDVHKTVDAELLTTLGATKRDTPLPPEMEGRPYHYISELPKIGGVPLLKVPWIQIYRAFDMGYFPDPACCLWLAVYGRRIIAVYEETWFKTIAKDLAVKMKDATTELVGDTPVVMTCADPMIDEQRGGDIVTVKDTLELHGVPIECSINDRVLYADAIHSLLGEEVEPGVPRFQVYEPGCPMLAKYLPKMRWDEKNPRKMADHKFDHWPVCLAYFGISSGVLSMSQAPEDAKEPEWMAWMREGTGRQGRRRA